MAAVKTLYGESIFIGVGAPADVGPAVTINIDGRLYFLTASTALALASYVTAAGQEAGNLSNPKDSTVIDALTDGGNSVIDPCADGGKHAAGIYREIRKDGKTSKFDEKLESIIKAAKEPVYPSGYEVLRRIQAGIENLLKDGEG